MLIRILVAAFAVAALVVGCSDSGESPTESGNGGGGGGATVSFADDVRPILQTAGCTATNCHGGGDIKGGLLLGSADYDTVIVAAGLHGPILTAGDASSSNLYLKTTPTPPFGDRMPFGGPYLSETQQNLIRDWINQGAQDN